MTTDQLINFFQRAIHPLRTTVYLLTGKAVITSVKDSEGIQEAQISALAGESMDKIPRVQNFGFTSNPPVGSEAIIISLGGLRENVVIVTADNREFRFKDLASGESAVYTDDGSVIHLKKGGLIEVKAATHLTVDVPDSTFKGNVKVEGTIEVDGAGTFHETVQMDKTLNVNLVVGAGGYSGPLGGAPMPVIMDVPLQSTSTISSDGDITSGGDVVSSETSHSDIKATFNAHVHPENNNPGGSTSATATPL